MEREAQLGFSQNGWSPKAGLLAEWEAVAADVTQDVWLELTCGRARLKDVCLPGIGVFWGLNRRG